MAIWEIAFGVPWLLVNIENPAAEWFVSPETPWWRYILLDVVDIFSRSPNCSKRHAHHSLWLAAYKHKRAHIHAVHPPLYWGPHFNYCLGLPLLPFNLNRDSKPQRSIYHLCTMFSALLSIYLSWLVSMEEPDHCRGKCWGRVSLLVMHGEPPNGCQGEWQLS